MFFISYLLTCYFALLCVLSLFHSCCLVGLWFVFGYLPISGFRSLSCLPLFLPSLPLIFLACVFVRLVACLLDCCSFSLSISCSHPFTLSLFHYLFRLSINSFIHHFLYLSSFRSFCRHFFHPFTHPNAFLYFVRSLRRYLFVPTLSPESSICFTFVISFVFFVL